MDKHMRAGYQGKKDSMRELADKLMSQKSRDTNDRIMDRPSKEKPKDVYYSKSCANKETMRPYKEGGRVMKDCHDYDNGSEKPEKFAEGGIGKYRHGQMSSSGKQLGTKKVPFRNTFK